MEKNYDPKAVEDKWYKLWEEKGYFHAEPVEGGEAYTVVIPPPNVTGILHMGHALNNIIQDVMVRWRRMQGRNTLWIPGTDHAGIATQNVVEKALRKQGTGRRDLGRDKFLAKVWEWRGEYGGTIVRQLRKLGASCDWQRERFTMDEGLSEAVAEVFCRLYDEGLIYRGKYIVNWCPRCHTALADEESEHQEQQGNLWHVRYPVEGGGDVVVATTRPETMLGDTAVAVNPEDERYAGLKGKYVLLPLVNRRIPVVFDSYVDPAFGTGVVKITPAHDPNDFLVAKRHDLAMANVMNGDGTMNEEAGVYNGLDRFECRRKVVADLEALGLLVKTEPHIHAVGHCYRCDTVVEPRLSAQWFVKMKPLAEPAVAALKSGKLKFTPQRWDKVYLEWMENIRDWCISRQIWWGHRIPVYTCSGCSHEWAAKTSPAACPKCGAANDKITQDEDVLDTWFSSWLWPFSTLGWPKQTEDLKFYYPTHDLVTASEIIFFWVARMVMAGIKFMGEVPFSTVHIHGTVRDSQGRKMSKSLGNSLDPLEIIDQYSADALRFSLMQITATGQDVFVDMDKFEIGRNFATKIWNAARFMKMHGEKWPEADWHELAKDPLHVDVALLRDDDRHLLSTVNGTIGAMNAHLANFRLQDGALAAYELVWTHFCDWYLEYAKKDLYGEDDARRRQTLSIMTNVFSKALRLLHPYMPFITEELWHEMGYGAAEETILKASWPVIFADQECCAWGVSESVREFVQNKRELITAGRALRAEYGIAPSRFIDYVIQTSEADRFAADLDSLKAQLRSENVQILQQPPAHAMPGAVCKLGTVYLPLDGLIDTAAEKKRLVGEIAKVQGFLKGIDAKLSNDGFVSKAPAQVIEQQRAKKAEHEETIVRLQKLLNALG